jgi:hypothetical protein
MPHFLLTALDNFLSPMALFFMLGFAAARLKSDSELLEDIGKGLSLYLTDAGAIAFKGGVELAGNGLSGQMVWSPCAVDCAELRPSCRRLWLAAGVHAP